MTVIHQIIHVNEQIQTLPHSVESVFDRVQLTHFSSDLTQEQIPKLLLDYKNRSELNSTLT